MNPTKLLYFNNKKAIFVHGFNFIMVVCALLSSGLYAHASVLPLEPQPIKNVYIQPLKDKIKDIEKKTKLKIQFFSIGAIPLEKLHTSINRTVRQVSGSPDYIIFFLRKDPTLISLRASPVVLMQRQFVNDLLQTIKKKSSEYLKNQKITIDKMLYISIDSIESSLNKYKIKTGWTKKYLNFIGGIYSGLYSLSLNDFAFYRTYILKPFFNIFIAILAVFNYSFWLFIVLIILTYHIKDILTVFPLFIIKKMSNYYTLKKKTSPKKVWIIQYIILLIDKLVKYLIPLPLLATIFLLTNGMPENAFFVKSLLINSFDIPRIINLLPLESSTMFGNISLHSNSGIIIGGLISVLGYLYFWFGFQILAIRWKVATCLKDGQWIQKVITRVGNQKVALSLIEYWRYMSYQSPIFGGGKLIVEDGLTVSQYMASKNWRPIVRGLAATILPLSLGVYFCWDQILTTLKAVNVYRLYKKRLKPIRELVP